MEDGGKAVQLDMAVFKGVAPRDCMPAKRGSICRRGSRARMKMIPLVTAVAFALFFSPSGAVDAVRSESVARQESTKLVEDQVVKVVVSK